MTQAVAKGMWVVIEDVDLAPFEVLAALVPLLEERRLYVPGRGESVPAAEGFQLFGTVTVGGADSGGGAAAGARADPRRGSVGARRRRTPSGDEPAAILVGMHPNLEPLAPAMLRTLNVAQRECGQGGAAAAPGGAEMDAEMPTDVEMDVDEGNEGKGVALVQGVGAGGESGIGGAHARAGRPRRDLLRWASSPRETPQIRTLAPAQGYIPPRRVTPQGSRRGVRGGGGRPRGHAPRGTRTEARPRVDGGVLGRRRRRRRTPGSRAETRHAGGHRRGGGGSAVLPAEESAAAAVAMGAAGGGGDGRRRDTPCASSNASPPRCR